MSYMYCTDCGEFFEECDASIVYEHHSELNGMGGITTEKFMACPYCGSTDIEEANECEICGHPTRKHYCKECVSDFFADLDEFFGKEEVRYGKPLKESLYDLTSSYLDSH